MILSRGVDEDGSRDPRRFSNRFYAYAIPYVWIAKPEIQAAGIHLVIAEKTIRIPSEAIDPTVKNFHWGDLIRGIYEAYDRGGFTAVLPDADGNGPESHPIKGNADSMLYHTPDSPHYRRTRAEVWFDTEASAEAAGFSKPAAQQKDSK